MLKSIRFSLFSAVLFFSASALSQDLERYNVSNVIIQGNRNVDSAAIRAQLKATSGSVSSQQISEEVKALYRTEFFEQVTASVVEEGGKRFIKYSVIEKPLVRKIFIKGNKDVNEEELSKILTFGPKRFLDKSKVEALMRSAVSYYQKEGFYDAAFEYSVVPVNDGQVDLTFTVTEGARVKIRKITIHGLKELDADDLVTEMQTRRYKWWSSWLLGTGHLNKEMLENDKLILRQYFLDHGYVDGSLGDPVIERKEDGLYIDFYANEGAQYKIGSITAVGDLVEDSGEQTLAETEGKAGEAFNASTIRKDSFKISDKFADKGYAFVNVVPNTSIDRSAQTVNIEYAINKGKQVKIGKINIKGNNKTYDNVIRREMRVDEQETFSASKVRRSQQVLQRLGYFEEVNINTEPTSKDDEVDLGVSVREASTGQFSAGAGFSSAEGVLFNAKVSENNLFGTGRNAAINFDIGSERNNLIFSLNDRRFDDTYMSLGAEALRSEREFSDFDRTLTGGSITAGYPLEQVFGEWAQDITSSLKYEALNVDISNIDYLSAAQLVIDSEGTSVSSGFTPTILRNTLNNTLDPTEGSLQEVSIELTGLGGDQEYYLLEGRQSLYYPLFPVGNGEWVFSWRTRVGYGETYDDEVFPLFRRYFPGGINSVRGYKSRSLGPKDDRGNEYGGSKQFINNFEFIIPLVSSAGLKFVTFYDMGEAFDDDEPIAFDDLRHAYGAGMRWSSPIGPIRVEFGWPIDREEGERNMVTNFSFGAPF